MKNKEAKTNAIRLLEQKKLNFKVHDYSQSDIISLSLIHISEPTRRP